MFYYFGLGLNLFLLLLLISKSGKSTADKILAAWLFIIACHLGLYIMSLQPLTIKTIHLLGTNIPFPLLHGPFLYLYTAAITNLLPANKKVWLLHFMPAVISVLYITPFYLLSAPQKMEIYFNEGRDYRTYTSFQNILMQLSGVVYVIWSFFLLRKHKKNIGQQFSYEERINLNWLRYLIYGLLILWGIIIFVKQDSFIFGGAVIFVTLIGFFGVKQAGIFNNIAPEKIVLQEKQDGNLITTKIINEINTAPINEPVENWVSEFKNEGGDDVVLKESVPGLAGSKKKKYAKSGLNEEAAQDLHKRLKELMETKELFKEPELTLSDLAIHLSIHPNYLSQVINDIEHVNFYDYINALRVAKFKKEVTLPENKHLTLSAISYDCGFNSKSAFNRFFKKSTGLSPSEYLKSIK
jgi:AraC-like DNA-binding protein